MVEVTFKDKKYHFCYTKKAITKMINSDLEQISKNVLKSGDIRAIFGLFSTIILMSYCSDSIDQLLKFENSACFRHLLKELMHNPELASEFIRGIMLSHNIIFTMEVK